MPGSSALPWRKPPRELLVLTLVALAALAPVYSLNPQDNARVCLSQSLVHGHLYNDGCFAFDRSHYGGHDYSDKAPGLSFAQLPLTEALRIPRPSTLHHVPWQLWLLRILTVGAAFLACAFVVGRISEGLAPGYGTISLVAFALGTLVAPYAAENFDQVPAAALGFGAFVLAWRRRPLAAGLLAGAAVVVEYEAAAIAGVVLLYLALATREARAVARYAAGAVPGVALLAVYDWIAFGAPWRLSYRYVGNFYRAEQASGFFGIGTPHLYTTYQVFAGSGGLLVASPVLVASVWGLLLLHRRHPLEVAACAAVAAFFVVVNCGYFLPYGGSPGPRFLVPALPFLAVGLGPAFALRPRLTAVLAFLSVFTVTALLLVWGAELPRRGGVWTDLVHVPSQLGASHFVDRLQLTAPSWFLPGRAWGAGIVALLALAAFAAAWRTMPAGAAHVGGHRGLVVAGVCVVAAAFASAVSGFPDLRPAPSLTASIQASTQTVHYDEEVDFIVTAYDSSKYLGYAKVYMTLSLSPGLQLLGPPAYERGSGCKGTRTLVCFLDDLSPRMGTPLRLSVRATRFGPQILTATVSAEGLLPRRAATYTFSVG